MRKGILLLCVFLLLCPLCRAEEIDLWSVNVGKADAHIVLSEDVVLLVDAGSAVAWPQVMRTLELLQIDRIDAVFLTHTDKDHAGGLSLLAQTDIPVGAWYASGFGEEGKKHPARLASALRGQEYAPLVAGDALSFAHLSVSVMAPEEEGSEENNNSLVLMVETDAGRALLTGDMLWEEEEILLHSGFDLSADILKVAYHGGNESTSREFLRRVNPSVAIVSTSTEERADTPSDAVLARLREVGAKTLVTQDATGGVHVSTDGTAEFYELSAPTGDIFRAVNMSVDPDDEIISLSFSEDADISGWILASDTGGEGWSFPKGTRIKAGETVTVGTLSTDTDTDFLWQEKNVLHNDKRDAVSLIDGFGRLLAEVG
ncbi:MAG: MBL fold metallo-hydrolase [Christensenellales bacterium]|jgi:competence protein ComEC